MIETVAIRSIRSALNQAGVPDTDFESRHFRFRELTGSVVRILCRPGARPEGLPATVGHCKGGDPACLCICPEEWLMVSERLSTAELIQQCHEQYSSARSAIYDCSDGLAILRLTGRAAPWLLAKLSGLDFFAAKSKKSHCARTRMQHLAVVVHFRSAGDGASYDLILDRSQAAYFLRLLEASAAHADDLAERFGDYARGATPAVTEPAETTK